MEPAYEVYVNAEAIIEINRGKHMTVAQTFGADWTAAPLIYTHYAALAPPDVPLQPQKPLEEAIAECARGRARAAGTSILLFVILACFIMAWAITR